MNELSKRKVAVIGLGYVGLPVAVAMARHYPVIGFDVNQARIEALQKGLDVTGEISKETLLQTPIMLTSDPEHLKQANFYIVTVPTPVDHAKQPDLTALITASQTIGRYLKQGDIVVYESTVYPGTTEDICGKTLERTSKLQAGRDFSLGYSPERINPSDKSRTFERITKVVSAQDPQTLDVVAEVYGSVVTAGIHRAPSIKVAEAAKVIENTQRDLNIALINELAVIFELMGIDTGDVLEAAETKWNFLSFRPGLVGGHCIGVDPYYLTYKAKQLGYRPEVIQAGRRINDHMGKYVAEQTVKQMILAGHPIKGARVAVLGLTFKENCSDLRNSRVMDVIEELRAYGIDPIVHDPIASCEEAQREYAVHLTDWKDIGQLNAMIITVAHEFYRTRDIQEYLSKLVPHAVISDVKLILDRKTLIDKDIYLWRL